MKTYRKAISAVCYRREKQQILYLLLKRKLHWKGWEFPKGGVDRGETMRQAVLREVKEETGQKPLKIKDHRISGKYKYPKFLDDRPDKIGQTYHIFSVELKSKTIKFDKVEHSGYKWLKFKDALPKLKWPNQKKGLRAVEKDLTKH